jgi:hypothetical protein
MAKPNKKRQEYYKRLRKVGFNSYEATKYKDLKPSKIEKIIKRRQEFNESIKEVG